MLLRILMANGYVLQANLSHIKPFPIIWTMPSFLGNLRYFLCGAACRAYCEPVRISSRVHRLPTDTTQHSVAERGCCSPTTGCSAWPSPPCTGWPKDPRCSLYTGNTSASKRETCCCKTIQKDAMIGNFFLLCGTLLNGKCHPSNAFVYKQRYWCWLFFTCSVKSTRLWLATDILSRLLQK